MNTLNAEFRFLFWAIIGVIVPFGFLLYFLPGSTESYWAWVIHHPRSAMLIGAAYLGAVPFYLLALRRNRWIEAQNGMGGLIVFCLVLVIATMAHWNEFRMYFLTTLVWLLFYYVGPFMVPIAYRKQLQTGTTATSESMRPGKAFRAWMTVRGFMYLSLAAFWLANAESIASSWPWPISPLELRVFTGQLAIVGWNAAVVLSGRDLWVQVRLGLLLTGAIGAVQLIGLVMESTPYQWTGFGLLLPLVFAEWLITPVLMYLQYSGRTSPGEPPVPSVHTVPGGFTQFGARLVGGVYTGLGLIGFLPIHFLNPMHHEGIGTRYLFNLVAINDAHNIIHLAIGVSGLLAARAMTTTRTWGRICGPVLLLVFAGGMIQAFLEGLPPDQLFLGLVPLNSPGHILHLVTGSVVVYLGLARTSS
jgi:hypothetical protein